MTLVRLNIKKISLKKNKAMIGKRVSVLVDTVDNVNSFSLGRTEKDAPDIDNMVMINSRLEPGAFINVTVKKAQEYDIFAEL